MFIMAIDEYKKRKQKKKRTDICLILGPKQLLPSFLSASPQLLIENLNKAPYCLKQMDVLFQFMLSTTRSGKRRVLEMVFS